jgi:hypothetical protein
LLGQRSIPGIVTFGPRLGNVVVSLAEGTTGSPAGQPWIHTRSVKRVTTCQSSDVVIIFQRIEADGTGISRCGEHFRRRCSANRIIIVIIQIGRDRTAPVDTDSPRRILQMF